MLCKRILHQFFFLSNSFPLLKIEYNNKRKAKMENKRKKDEGGECVRPFERELYLTFLILPSKN